MRSSAQAAFTLVQRLKTRGVAQVEGYRAFRFLRETELGVVVSREAGEDTAIPFAKIVEAVEAARKDPAVYVDQVTCGSDPAPGYWLLRFWRLASAPSPRPWSGGFRADFLDK